MNIYIQKLGKYLKTDIRYLLHGGFHMTTEYVVSVVFGIGFGFLVANKLNPTEYGIYKYILSVGGTIGAITLTGLSVSLTQAIARGHDGALRQICMSQMRWSIPAVVLGLLIGGYYLFKEAYVLGFSIVAITILIPFRDVGALSSAYLSGKELFRLKARLNIIRTLVITTTLSIFVYFFHEAHLMVFMQYLLEALSFLLILWFVFKKYPPTNEDVGDEISFGRHLSFVDVVQRLFGQADKLFVFQFLGATALASYSIALMPVTQLNSFTRIIRMLVAPRFSKRSFREIHASIFHKAFIMFLFSCVIMLLYVVSVPYIYAYLLPQYTGVIFMAQVASLVLLFTPQTLFGQVLVAKKCKKQLYYGIVSINASLVACVFIGGIYFGIFGVLVGYIISRGITFGINIIAYYHAYHEYLASAQREG